MENKVIANRYRVLKHLGKGAQASVFLAEDLHEKRQVAVKVLGQLSSDTPQLVKRFQREFSACKKFDHPNVVKIFDLGRVENGAWFYTMEFLPHPSLRAVLNKRKRLPEIEAATILKSVASGCAHFHSFGVVHRDLKPENIVYAAAERPVIVDFGLAREEEATALTATGTMLGTPFYMAPEMVIGERADNRADIYAVGVMAFFLLSGQKPFDGADVMELMTKIINTKPPHVTDIDDKLSPMWDPFIDKCLAKDAEDRYEDAMEMEAILSQILTSLGVAHERPKKTISKVSKPLRKRQSKKAKAPSITDSAAVSATETSSTAVSQPRGRAPLVSLILLFSLLLLFCGYSFLKEKELQYGFQDLVVEEGPGNLLVQWKSNLPYPSQLEVKGKKGVFLFHGEKREATKLHIVNAKALDEDREYSIRILFPNGKASLSKKIRTRSLDVTNVHLDQKGHLCLQCRGATGVVILAGKKIFEAQREGANKWHIPWKVKNKDLDSLFAEITIINSGEKRKVPLAPLVLDRLKRKASSLLQFSKEKFLDEMHRKETAYYKVVAAKEIAKRGSTPSKDWNSDRRKESRGRAMKEYAERMHTREAFSAITLNSPLIFEHSLYTFKEQKEIHSAYATGMLISLYSHFRKLRPPFIYSSFPSLGEFGFTVGRRRGANIDVFIHRDSDDDFPFGPARIGFYSKTRVKAELSFTLANIDRIQWAEVLIETGKDFSWVMWVNVNSKLSLPIAIEPYLNVSKYRGKTLPLVQRIPRQVLLEGRNSLVLTAEHAFEGISRDTTRLHRVIFYGRSR